MKGFKRYKPPAIKQVSHGDVIHNIRNVVSNVLITSHEDRWVVTRFIMVTVL